ncbi:MAG: hypothetical protein HYX67_11980 [Candidatus Melainabacteria bacterium]|nr:hypothetical protein [Candidatus Melainabacteria bacterium]
MTRGFLPIALSVLLSAGSMPLAFAASDSQLNFKIYSPDGATTAAPKPDESLVKETPATASETSEPAAAPAEEKAAAPAAAETATTDKSNESTTVTESKPELTKEEPVMSAPATSTTADTDTAPTPSASTASESTTTTDAPAASAFDTTGGDKQDAAPAEGKTVTAKADKQLLQGYVHEVPAQTKIPIIMDTAVDSDTSQEGDEFSARTSEDLTIDGAIVVPAGSIIKGRIAQLNSPKHFNRSGSIALKFDTVTTPDNRSIPLVANLVAHGGVVHARRGLKDYAIDGGTVMLPVLAGTLIGVVAGKSNTTNNNTNSNNNSNNSNGMGKGTAMALGAGVGIAVGVAILCAKKGKKVDVRPGDELKIELAEALRMPMM